MARGIARMFDGTFGVCFCHRRPIAVGGRIISGDFNTLLDGRPVARFGDTVKASCGHTGRIISSSTNVLTGSLGVARLGDIGSGCYKFTITSASNETIIP